MRTHLLRCSYVYYSLPFTYQDGQLNSTIAIETCSRTTLWTLCWLWVCVYVVDGVSSQHSCVVVSVVCRRWRAHTTSVQDPAGVVDVTRQQSRHAHWTAGDHHTSVQHHGGSGGSVLSELTVKSVDSEWMAAVENTPWDASKRGFEFFWQFILYYIILYCRSWCHPAISVTAENLST